MEKILLALDAGKPNMGSIDFACYLCRLTRSRLTGVFLEDILYRDRVAMQTMHGESEPSAGGDADTINAFKMACENREVQTLVHRDRGVPESEIVEESRFADLVIVDPETSFTRGNETLPGHFVKSLLLHSECPVIISPYSFESIDTIIFAYNGTRSSVFAIKQFTYLFPELRQKKAIVVSVRTDGGETLSEQFKMKEWLKNHYSELEYIILNGAPSDQLFGYLIEKKNAMVVMGAYGRDMISRFFKPSHARLIVRTVNLPLFISHY
jgi:hypothetical protein